MVAAGGFVVAHVRLANRRLVVYKAHFLPGDPGAFERPAYLSHTGTSWRAVRDLARFRMGEHGLRSVPDHRQPDQHLPFRERVCQRCPCTWPALGVDDEHHLLFDCACTAPIRDKYLGLLADTPQRTVHDLMTNRSYAVAMFVRDCMECVQPFGT